MNKHTFLYLCVIQIFIIVVGVTIIIINILPYYGTMLQNIMIVNIDIQYGVICSDAADDIV